MSSFQENMQKLLESFIKTKKVIQYWVEIIEKEKKLRLYGESMIRLNLKDLLLRTRYCYMGSKRETNQVLFRGNEERILRMLEVADKLYRQTYEIKMQDLKELLVVLTIMQHFPYSME